MLLTCDTRGASCSIGAPTTGIAVSCGICIIATAPSVLFFYLLFFLPGLVTLWPALGCAAAAATRVENVCPFSLFVGLGEVCTPKNRFWPFLYFFTLLESHRVRLCDFGTAEPRF